MKKYSLLPFLIMAIALFSCKSDQEEINMRTTTHKYSYLALGDSYTIGENVSKEARWGEQLAAMLRADGIDVSDPVTIARTGWTTSELASAIRSQNPPADFDMVSLLIGVNNQFRGQSVSVYRTEFKELLQTSIRLARNNPNNVVVLSTPDWGATPFGTGRNRQQIAEEIDLFNAVAKQEAENAGITFINITPLTRQFGADATYLANDGLHYSGKMHREWALLVLPVAKNILKK
jgi:lysophospholipase L1-like esterase